MATGAVRDMYRLTNGNKEGQCQNGGGQTSEGYEEGLVCRPDSLTRKHKAETGGLSGEPLWKMATGAVRDMYRL